MNQTKVFCISLEQNGGEYFGQMFMRALDVNRDENNSKKIHVKLNEHTEEFPIVFDECVMFIESLDEMDSEDKFDCNIGEEESI